MPMSKGTKPQPPKTQRVETLGQPTNRPRLRPIDGNNSWASVSTANPRRIAREYDMMVLLGSCQQENHHGKWYFWWENDGPVGFRADSMTHMSQMDSNKFEERSLEVNIQSVQRSLLSIFRYHALATSVLHVAPNNLIDLSSSLRSEQNTDGFGATRNAGFGSHLPSAEALLSRQKCCSTHLQILLETKKSPKFAAEFPQPLPAITGRKWCPSASFPIIHFRCHGSAVKFARQKRQLILATRQCAVIGGGWAPKHSDGLLEGRNVGCNSCRVVYKVLDSSFEWTWDLLHT